MRQKRAKAYRKLMHVYSMSFGFRQPYQVLVDSEMCSEAVNSKIDLARQLAIVLQGAVKPMITQCSIHSLYLAGESTQPVVDVAKTFERRRCNHREALPEEECLREVIGPTNKHRYVLAAQSTSLRQHVRQIPGTPIVHVKRSVMVLEPASESTEKAKSAMEANRLKPSEAERSTIASTLVEGNKTGAEATTAPRKKRKGPKGPNPLSVKKKRPKENNRRPQAGKPNEMTGESPQSVGEKRKRDDNDDGHDTHERIRAPEEHTGSEVFVKRTRKRVRKRKRVDEDQARARTENEGPAGS